MSDNLNCRSLYGDFNARSRYRSLLWDVITYLCLRYLLLAPKSSYLSYLTKADDFAITKRNKTKRWVYFGLRSKLFNKDDPRPDVFNFDPSKQLLTCCIQMHYSWHYSWHPLLKSGSCQHFLVFVKQIPGNHSTNTVSIVYLLALHMDLTFKTLYHFPNPGNSFAWCKMCQTWHRDLPGLLRKLNNIYIYISRQSQY